MALTVAVTGKSGSGKTTVVKNMLSVFREVFPEKTILLFDNDLTCELGHTFGKDVRKTIYGIRSGKHEYKTGIPENMTKQEFIEWAIEDILEPLDDNTDLIVSWLSASKDCRCPITKQMNDAIVKLIERYDFVIFDCEYDLKYLHQLVDYPIDTTLLVTNPSKRAVELAGKIFENSKKYASSGQFGVILNKAREDNVNEAIEVINSMDLNFLGLTPEFKGDINSEEFESCLKTIYARLNLPQG